MTQVPFAFEFAVLKYPEAKGLVSIIIPIYNTDIYLREALESVLAQTFENWEAILIDDGSTDKSPEICAEYAEKNSKFKYVRKKENEGLLLARKTGLENACGEFIANLDSDDAYKPQFLEKMFEKIKDGKNDFVYCDYDDMHGRQKLLEVKNCKLGENKLDNVQRHRDFGYTIWNKLIKRSLYAKVLFPQIAATNGEDLIQMSQILYHSEHTELIPENLYIYRSNSAISSSKSFKIISREKRIVQNVVLRVAYYLLMEKLFGTLQAERMSTGIPSAYFYFLLSKKAIACHKIEYMENFIPLFLRELEKTENKGIRRTVLIWACKGFPLPFRVLRSIKRIFSIFLLPFKPSPYRI
ncbi:MAG: glycosyltransferase [Fibromonadales bacterium]|nr:glycosyltransferase [Fibromonadales bacterium]